MRAQGSKTARIKKGTFLKSSDDVSLSMSSLSEVDRALRGIVTQQDDIVEQVEPSPLAGQ